MKLNGIIRDVVCGGDFVFIIMENGPKVKCIRKLIEFLDSIKTVERIMNT